MTFSGGLRDFAQDLIPNREEKIQYGEAIDDVLQKISDHFGEERVNRIEPSGRTPQKSAVSGMTDVEIYIYMNDPYPPKFHPNDIAKITEMICSFDQTLSKNDLCVYFKYKGVNISLLAAKNFLPSNFTNPDQDGNHVREFQHANALRQLHLAPAESRHQYITSMSCISVLFEEKRDSFSHSLSRLAKFWFSQHRNADKVVDGLRIMEYLGARAAEEERMTEDLAKGFSRFLTMMTKPECITVFWMEYYDSSDIPESVKSQRPLLLDPCNPYNNMLGYGNNTKYISGMKDFAKATLERFDNAERHFKLTGRLKSFKEVFLKESLWCRFL